MSKSVILIVDDQPWQIAKLKEELEDDYVCMEQPNPIDAAQLLQAGVDIDAIILDIMMPAPSIDLIHRTEQGLNTGFWFLEQMSDLLISKGIPVLIVSNRVIDVMRAWQTRLNYPPGQLHLFFRQTTPNTEICSCLQLALRKRGEFTGFSTEGYLSELAT